MLSELYFYKHSSGEWLMRSGDYIAFLFTCNRPELFWKKGALEITNNNRKLLKIYDKPFEDTFDGVY